MLNEILSKLLIWTQETFLPYGVYGLFLLSFIEAIFFPIPPDVLLIILVWANPALTWLYVLAALIGSVMGASIAHKLGTKGNKYLLQKKYFKKYKKQINKVHKYFQKYEFLTVFISGFTPIPYKVVSWAAGIFYVDFKKFIAASILGRGLRFIIVALATLYAEQSGIIQKMWANWEITSIIIAVVAIIFGLIYVKHFQEKIQLVKEKVEVKIEEKVEKVEEKLEKVKDKIIKK